MHVEPALKPPFTSLFERVRTIELAEPPLKEIVEITRFTIGPNGKIVITEDAPDRIRIHESDGTLSRLLGRFGEAPGELDNPRGAAISASGQIGVVDSGNDRLTFYDADGEPSLTKRLPGWGGRDLLPLNDGFLAGIAAERRELFAIISPSGEIEQRFFFRDPETFSIPYWISMNWEEAAVGGGRIYIATNFLYPVHVYGANGDSLGFFGTPPESWIPPSRPERGQFVGPGGMTRSLEWLRSFTIISGLAAYRDSLVFVVHGRLDPTVNDFYRVNDYALDVYTRDGIKRYEDVPVPGRILYGDSLLYVLLNEPPGPWTVGVYEWALEHS